MFLFGTNEQRPSFGNNKNLLYSTGSYTICIYTFSMCVCVCACAHALCLVTQSCLTLCNPMDNSPPGSSVHGDSPGKNTGVGCPPSGDLSNPGIKPVPPALQADSLLPEPSLKLIYIYIYIHKSICMYIHTYVGQRNGNPLQYSRLEKPMDRGAWWATVHGVT